METYTAQVKELIEAVCEAVCLWGVLADPPASQGDIGLIAKAATRERPWISREGRRSCIP